MVQLTTGDFSVTYQYNGDSHPKSPNTSSLERIGIIAMNTPIKEIIGRGLTKEKKEEINQILDQTNPQEVNQMIYNMEIALKDAMEKAELKGKLEGKHEGKVETARKLFALGIELTVISKAVEMPKEEVERLNMS